jgi:hypothetical protein
VAFVNHNTLPVIYEIIVRVGYRNIIVVEQSVERRVLNEDDVELIKVVYDFLLIVVGDWRHILLDIIQVVDCDIFEVGCFSQRFLPLDVYGTTWNNNERSVNHRIGIWQVQIYGFGSEVIVCPRTVKTMNLRRINVYIIQRIMSDNRQGS